MASSRLLNIPKKAIANLVTRVFISISFRMSENQNYKIAAANRNFKLILDVLHLVPGRVPEGFWKESQKRIACSVSSV